MADAIARTVVDLEWPTRYLLDCGHAVPIAPDASVAEMPMPGQLLVCPTCGGNAPEVVRWPSPFGASEAINADTLNRRLAEIGHAIAGVGGNAMPSPAKN